MGGPGADLSTHANDDQEVIDFTDSFDGCPVDISSPHRNQGEHKEEMM